MIALTLTFETITPFFGNSVVTVTGNTLDDIKAKIDKQFLSVTTLNLYTSVEADNVGVASLNVNKRDYEAKSLLTTYIL